MKTPLPAICFLMLASLTQPLSAQGGDATENARKYAREGLKAALEELQAAAGPDQRVTARASILSDNGIERPHLTGVWQSSEIDPDNLVDDYAELRVTKFMKWLVSAQDASETNSLDYPNATSNDAVTLLGEGTLGNAGLPEGIVKADRVPANDPLGNFAWVVLDEGVKARINTPYLDDGGTRGLGGATMELGSGKRPRAEFVEGLELLEQDSFRNNPDLNDLLDTNASLENGPFSEIKSELMPLSHDVTFHSMGVFCDVARGGLKRDFHLMSTTGNLPEEFANKRVYETQLGLSEPSDPYWQYLVDFANLRPQSTGNNTPELLADVPDNYTPYDPESGNRFNPFQAVIGQPEEGTHLLPTIASIRFIFGTTVEPIPDPLPGNPTHRLNLTYKPVVTLHNPYNVALKLDRLKISFANLPFAVQFTVNGIDMTPGFLPLDLISLSRFELIIGANPVDIVLQPGEVRIFGSEGENQKDRARGIKEINMVPGFDPSAGYYLLDRLRSSSGSIDLLASDSIGTRITPRAHTPLSGNRFVVTMEIGDARKAGVIEMIYETPEGIENALSGNQNFPLQLEVRTANQLIAAASVGGQLPIAVLSLRSKTTSTEEANPGKPWCFAHALSGISRNRFSVSHPMDHTHEFDLTAINSFIEAPIQTNFEGRGFYISGETPEFGVNFGLLYEVPLAPIQSFSTLNGADPTGVSGYLPRFAQPIGNSWAHPLIASGKIRGGNPDPSGDYDYLDHSFLLNLALYDQFYFSGLADQNDLWFSPSPRSTFDLARQFSSETPFDDPRLLLYRPNGQRAADFVEMIEEDPDQDAYRQVSAWQMMKGAFNVNSTSVNAWRAMLASVHDENAKFWDARTTQISNLNELQSGKARISRFRLPGSESTEDRLPESYWLGPREVSEEDFDRLAEAIVEQVRARGPFLSMGDFVNRRLTRGDPELALSGALQAAIDRSEINLNLADPANAGGIIRPSALADNPNYLFPEAAEGASYQGAPGCISQADLLAVLGNTATVRSDTFTIRSYGESLDAEGQLQATAWCEAVFQRVPDWVDPADKAETPPDQLVSVTNQALGRRFRLIHFRWLAPDEV